MTSNFFNFYISNLDNLCVEMYRSQRLIQTKNDNIKMLSMEADEKLKQLFHDTIKHQKSPYKASLQSSHIKQIYLLLKQIQKNETEKTSLTRNACDILDKYIARLNERIKTDSGNNLHKAIVSVKREIEQPVQGSAAIIDLIKKIEKENEPRNEKKFNVLERVEMLNLAQNFEKLTFKGIAKELKCNVFDRVDNLQLFNDSIVDICSVIENRYQIGESSHTVTNTKVEEENLHTEPESTGMILCHCRAIDLGAMVACDNSKCDLRWYHFECVAVNRPPSGTWYCPSCLIFGNLTVE